MSEAGRWESVIGLEVHVQLRTRSKLFSAAATAYGAPPNTQACEVTIALPGVLPVMNIEAARLAVRFGVAIGARINQRSVFARKNYFYPDLPKGYQISQFEQPIVGNGELEIALNGRHKAIGITRAHLEEDAGKSLHKARHGMSGIDLNRAGTPLLEIVSEPDLRSADEAVAYLHKLHALVRYLDISDGNMQEGSFRCDVNISVRPRGEQQLGTRTELKNINSFRFVSKAIDYEVRRQIELIEAGSAIIQETRLYDADRHETRPMRSKEEAHDYRYFPDPDLPPLVLDDAFIEQVRQALPELPEARTARLVKDYPLNPDDAVKLVLDRPTADYFEAVCAAGADAPAAVNWILGELAAALAAAAVDIDHSRVSPTQLAALLTRIADGTISGKIAKDIFSAVWRGEGEVDDLIERKGVQQISHNADLEPIIDRVLENHPAQVLQYRQGQTRVMDFFVGQVMRQTRGKANPGQVNRMLRKKLD